MKLSRILVLCGALGSAGVAVMILNHKAPPKVQIIKVPDVPTTRVLTAAKKIDLGTVLSPDDMAWTAWPKASISAKMITQDTDPQALTQDVGAIARSSMEQGEPVFLDRLVKGTNQGFMSAILPSGMRAVAINIDGNGATSAGGFILPNDHVDVLHTYRDAVATKAKGTETFVTDAVLKNVRVLAIGQNIKEQNGKPVVVGSTATLELSPSQAETAILAQKSGSLTLSLRSLVDSNGLSITQAEKNAEDATGNNITVVRFGVPVVSGPQ